MSLKEYTKGSEEYFAEREAKITAHINDAKTKIEEIEGRVRGEITAIQEQRDKIRMHLEGFIAARNGIVTHRERTIELIDELNKIVLICNSQLPALDEMLDTLENRAQSEDQALEGAENSRHRQLHKHERKKTRFELRQARLKLRKDMFYASKGSNE
jgi:hypothetical protein